MKVSHLTRYLKYLVEHDEFLTALSVEGEICEFSRSMAGHSYFTIKDEASQVSCVLFRREASHQVDEVEQLRKGISVVVHGLLTLYEPKGTYQIFVERVLVQGDGASAQRFARLKTKLESEGLFSLDRKRQLPRYPRKLALITSPGSQAYHDVLHRLKTQYPFVTVIEAGVSVQGESSANEITMAIDIVNRLTGADVILLVRGGGAPEDLVSFNDERVARAIYASRIPVVTGIGHETDYTIADFVADHRAATPSLAAAAAVPDVGAVVAATYQLHDALTQSMRQRLRLERTRWLEVNRALLRASPQNRLRVGRQRNDELSRAARRAMQVNLRSHRARVQALSSQLNVLDPLAILRRGYAVLSDIESGRAITAGDQVSPGQRLRAQVASGEFIVERTFDD